MNIIFNETQEAKRLARRVAAIVPKELKETFKEGGINAFLCGGVFVSLLCGDKVRDLDFFFPTQEDLNTAKLWVFSKDKAKIELFISDNAINFKFENIKIQFITKIFLPTVAETLMVFDFRAVMCGMTMEDIYNHQGFWSEVDTLYDIASKQLVVMPQHRNPHNVVFRIARYVERGWKIKGLSFVKLILQQLIRAKHIHTLADVRDEILGLDTLILTRFFKEFKKFPPEQPMDELKLKEFQEEVDEYFEKWAEEHFPRTE